MLAVQKTELQIAAALLPAFKHLHSSVAGAALTTTSRNPTNAQDLVPCSPRPPTHWPPTPRR